MNETQILQAQHSKICKSNSSRRTEVRSGSPQSAVYIFENSIGDKDLDAILKNIKKNPNGISKSEIHKIFGNHKKDHEIDAALSYLVQLNKIEKLIIPTDGRSKQLYIAAA